jgi:hypothetical protein
MGKMVLIRLVVIISMVSSTISGPIYGAQLAINSNDPVLYGCPIANPWTDEIMGNYFGFDHPGNIIIWESKQMTIASKFKNSFQWSDLSHNMIDYPSDSAVRKVFQPDGTVWMHNWATEEIFSYHNLISSKEIQLEEKDDTSGPPPLPSALWICGFGIIGILSVRRTSDHSNVA